MKLFNKAQCMTKLNKNHAGFSLIELLVVITLMGLLAATAAAFVNTLSEQERNDIPYDLTKLRQNQIRHAIIGDTTRTLNDEPMLSGYVADMGRLPANINELITLGTQPPYTEIPLYDAISGYTPITGVPEVLAAGWRGPYLMSAPEGAFRTFRDGWATQSNPVSPSNFGWLVRLIPETPACTTVPNSCTEIAIQSLGADGLPGGADFNADYPDPAASVLVSANEWQLVTPNIQFNITFNKPPLANQTALELRIYYFKDDADNTTLPEDLIVVERSDIPFDLPTTPPIMLVSTSITLDITPLPMGKYAALVWCTLDESGNPTNVIYDGDCDATPTPAVKPYYFSLLPNMALPPTVKIHWNIP